MPHPSTLPFWRNVGAWIPVNDPSHCLIYIEWSRCSYCMANPYGAPGVLLYISAHPMINCNKTDITTEKPPCTGSFLENLELPWLIHIWQFIRGRKNVKKNRLCPLHFHLKGLHPQMVSNLFHVPCLKQLLERRIIYTILVWSFTHMQNLYIYIYMYMYYTCIHIYIYTLYIHTICIYIYIDR